MVDTCGVIARAARTSRDADASCTRFRVRWSSIKVALSRVCPLSDKDCRHSARRAKGLTVSTGALKGDERFIAIGSVFGLGVPLFRLQLTLEDGSSVGLRSAGRTRPARVLAAATEAGLAERGEEQGRVEGTLR
jgi:hypothetical protein